MANLPQQTSLSGMPFEKGHQINAGRALPNRATSETKRAMKNLALSIREGVHPDAMRDWLVSVWQGRDPLTSEPGVVDLKTRMQALQMLKEYGWGMAPQHHIIEADIRAEMIAQEAPASRKNMTLEEVNARRAQLRAAGVQPRIIDAKSTEHKALPESSDSELDNE